MTSLEWNWQLGQRTLMEIHVCSLRSHRTGPTGLLSNYSFVSLFIFQTQLQKKMCFKVVYTLMKRQEWR